MTTTASNDEERFEAPPPPRHADVLAELQQLRRQEGVTPARMDAMGGRLMRLPISRDELKRSGMYEDEIALATIQALRCEVESYNRPEFRVGDRPDPRWVVLRHELNLDQSLRLYLGERQHDACAELGLSEKTYPRRADAIFSNFAHVIMQRQESPCRSEDEWLLPEAEAIDDLPRAERVTHVRDLLLLLSPTARRDYRATRSVLARAMPQLADLLDQRVIGPNSTPGDAVFAALSDVGRAHYDDVAEDYVIETLSNDGEVLLLPWETLSQLILTAGWPSDGATAVAAQTLDTLLEFEDFTGLFGPHHVEHAMFGGLFYDATAEEPTEVFHRAFDTSVTLFAEMLCELDGLGRWEMLPKTRPFDRIISRVTWTQTIDAEVLSEKIISNILVHHRRGGS